MKNKKFIIIEEGIFDNLSMLTSKELSNLLGGCVIEACGAKVCGIKFGYTDAAVTDVLKSTEFIPQRVKFIASI
jgi:hypothetical protein